MPSNESDKDTIPHPKEDFYGKNIPKCAGINSTISSKGVERKFTFQNANIN